MKGNIEYWDMINIFQKLWIFENSLHTTVWLSLMKTNKKSQFVLGFELLIFSLRITPVS